MKPQYVRGRIEQLDNLPTIPPVVRKHLATLDAENLSFKDLGEMIARDQAITARLLKLVNSPIYGFPGRISSVSQALILLGLHVVKGVLLGVSVFEIMEKTIVGLWQHSLFTALAAREIAAKKGLSEPEEMMTSALLHDIGKVALKVNFPSEYSRALTRAKEGNILIKDAEEAVFSLSHPTAGGWLAREWNFPITLSWVVQAVTGMVILVMGSIHMWTVLTSLPITAGRSAFRIQGGWWLLFYMVLLPPWSFTWASACIALR